MRCKHTCNSAEHFSRRGFLQGVTGGALGMAGFRNMVSAEGAQQLASSQKQVVVFWMSGGVSQLETWDPKPATDTGGPFQTIPTSVPGVHISELLPYTAQQMHHLALVRSINTNNNDHAKGDYMMQTGYRQTPGFEYPFLGSAFSSLLAPEESPLPHYLVLQTQGDYGNDSAFPLESSFLGPQHAPVSLRGGKPPTNLARPLQMPATSELRRRQLRAKLGQRFSLGRPSDDVEVYNASFEQAAAMMNHREMFDFEKFSAKDLERYGTHPFARHCLIARKLLENGITFVKIRHTDYDSHSENFNFHLEQLGEWDRPFATFVGDLAERGMLEQTLIIVMCEFGRTPKINVRMGRDHWGTAWSIALGGCGIQPGAVVGKTNANGTAVVDREVDSGHLFHTFYRAVGLDPTEDFVHEGRPFHRTDPKASAIQEILA